MGEEKKEQDCSMKFKIWPSHSFDIYTAFPPEKITSILQAHSEPRFDDWYARLIMRRLRSYGHLYFEGEISKYGFKIQHIIQYGGNIIYHNPFVPMITGVIIPEGTGSVVKIKMETELGPFLSAFMKLWFGGVAVCAILAIAAVVAGAIQQAAFLFIPFAMFILVRATASLGFWFEALQQRKKLISLVRA